MHSYVQETGTGTSMIMYHEKSSVFLHSDRFRFYNMPYTVSRSIKTELPATNH